VKHVLKNPWAIWRAAGWAGVLVVAGAARGEDVPRPLPPASTTADSAEVVPLPPVEQDFFSRIRLAAFGDPQDLS
jgi:hypothetical protein